MSVEFCDTNLLVYAYDTSAGARHERAGALIQRLWDTESGAVSVQVLQELFVTLTRKIPRPLDPIQARERVANLSTWRVAAPSSAEVPSTA
jgi:predicted nucleic acid-binding protein